MEIENLADIFRTEVLTNREDLNDFTQGSVLYTLARAVSATVLESYVEMENLVSRGLILDPNVDEAVVTSVSPSLSRIQGTRATGSVLASNLTSSAITIPPGTALVDPATTLQFNTSNTEDITLAPLVETPITVIASETGADFNLPAGRNLINVLFTRVVFTVGSFRDIDNTPKSDIAGGSSIESDNEYFLRLKNRLLYDRVGQKQALINVLEERSDITAVNLELVAGGLVTIWVTSPSVLSEVVKSEINTTAEEFLPIGTYSQVKQLINRSVTVRLFSFEEINLTTEELIIQIVTDYVEGLSIGSSLAPSAIRNLVSNRTGIVMKVLDPLEVIDLEEGERFLVSKVEVTNEA